MNKTFIAIALVSSLIIVAPAEAAPQQNQQQQLNKKNKVSQKTALKRCNLSVQDKYSHYARYCSMLSPNNINRRQKNIVITPIQISYADNDSAAAFFAADRARSNDVQVVSDTRSASKIKQTTHSPVKRSRSFGTPDPLRVAKQWEGYHAQRNRSELRNLLTEGNGSTIDPVKIPWCAAFANAILKQTGREGTGSLQARSFLGYGIATKYPKEGDIVVFSRGRNRSAGHVGFYKGEETIEGVKYILVFGGNQNKEVNVAYYPASKLLGYRSLG